MSIQNSFKTPLFFYLVHQQSILNILTKTLNLQHCKNLKTKVNTKSILFIGTLEIQTTTGNKNNSFWIQVFNFLQQSKNALISWCNLLFLIIKVLPISHHHKHVSSPSKQTNHAPTILPSS